jgi:HNH endonuclease
MKASFEVRFWLRVDKNGSPPPFDPTLGPCWIWLGAVTKGYGRVYKGDRNLMAHKVAFELTNGPVPNDLELDHLCRETLCVNPDHLEPVTRKTNLHRSPLYQNRFKIKH